MKAKVVSIVIAVLMTVLVLPGCVSKAELEKCRTLVAEQAILIQSQNTTIAEQAVQIQSQNTTIEERAVQITELEGKIEVKDAQIAELEEEEVKLEAEIECLRQPPPEKVSGEIAGYISFKETVGVARELFTRAGASAYTRGPYPLVSAETLKFFLADDQTNKYPESCRPNPYDAGDGRAFQLKAHWIEAGLPPWSLGLLKVEADIQYYGRMLVWRNIFLTKENDEFVFYEVDPCTDGITKIEEPSERYRVVMITDRIWIN